MRGTCFKVRDSWLKQIGNGKTLRSFSWGFFHAAFRHTPQRVGDSSSVALGEKVGRLQPFGKSVWTLQKVGEKVVGKFSTRQGSRVGSVSRSDPRKPSLGRLINVIMECTHSVHFRDKIKPSPGEVIWCSKCARYKEVIYKEVT